ncbi:MAG: hypothetical protein GF349_00345 [Candidatus Magasanikbacteria bacterium]|nr:hypothetical protein [Candidatus Magasanikbacteria bacterium]
MFRTAKLIDNSIKESKHILLVPHQNPDGDALGSVTAMIRYFDKNKKKYSTYCKTDIPERFDYLPHSHEIGNEDSVWNNSDIDLIIILDSGDLKYAGIDDYIKKIKNKPKIINIDHHATNEFYGDHNLVLPHASSTAEVLFNYFRYNRIQICKKMATSLLTGIITDTDNFTNAATTVTSLSAASYLIKSGGDLSQIKESILKDRSLASLKLWGVVLSRLTMHEKTEIAHTYLSQKDLKKHKVNEEEAEGIANFLNNLSDGKASLILKEASDNKIKGSLRTTRDDIDVSEIAKKFGGGGHKKAAGFTVDGPMDKAVSQVFREIGE